MGEADFNQFNRQRNQLSVAAENFFREEKLSRVLYSTLSKEMEEQLKLVHKATDLVDCSNRRIFVILLPYKVDNPENSYAQIRLLGHTKEEVKFHFEYINYKLEEFVYLLDVMNSVFDKIIANQPVCNVF